MVQKARMRPDLVRQVMDNFRREGLAATYNKVRDRLDNYREEPGYSSAGVVVESDGGLIHQNWRPCRLRRRRLCRARRDRFDSAQSGGKSAGRGGPG